MRAVIGHNVAIDVIHPTASVPYQFGSAYSTAGNVVSLCNSEAISGSASYAFSWAPCSFELILITLRYLSSL